MKVKTAVLPVAGLGSRVMPLTLHQPKAMIGIVDRPMIHYVIEEIVAAGIRRIVIVAGPEQKEFRKYCEHLKNDPEWKKSRVQFHFVIQKKPRGNGDAVYLAKKFLGTSPFLVCFADDLLVDVHPPMKHLVQLFEKTGAPTIILEPVPKSHVSRYGVVRARKSPIAKDLYQIQGIVEKPAPEKAPSNLTIIGRYVLNADILKEISRLYPYRGEEIGLAYALENYTSAGNPVYGWHFRGKRFDAGSKIGIMKAQTYFGLHHKEFGPLLKKYIKKELRGSSDL